ncbi:MAG: von Willebrand factor type A domain-containing protein [Rubripirellula sp.]|nr:von Willebrand factor type A domain-containing protein [Rubripirellula sp.]
MNEKSHPGSIDPQLEARLVALVLGEASDFERDELNRLIEQSPELAVFLQEMQTVHGLLREVGSGDSISETDDWKLPSKKRNAVLAAIDGQAAPQTIPAATIDLMDDSASQRRRLIRNIASIAAMFLFIGFVWTVMNAQYSESTSVAGSNAFESAVETPATDGGTHLWFDSMTDGAAPGLPSDALEDEEVEMDFEEQMVLESPAPISAGEYKAEGKPQTVRPSPPTSGMMADNPTASPPPAPPMPNLSTTEGDFRYEYSDGRTATFDAEAKQQQGQQQQRQTRSRTAPDQGLVPNITSGRSKGSNIASEESRDGRLYLGIDQSAASNSAFGETLQRPSPGMNGPGRGGPSGSTVPDLSDMDMDMGMDQEMTGDDLLGGMMGGGLDGDMGGMGGIGGSGMGGIGGSGMGGMGGGGMGGGGGGEKRGERTAGSMVPDDAAAKENSIDLPLNQATPQDRSALSKQLNDGYRMHQIEIPTPDPLNQQREINRAFQRAEPIESDSFSQLTTPNEDAAALESDEDLSRQPSRQLKGDQPSESLNEQQRGRADKQSDAGHLDSTGRRNLSTPAQRAPKPSSREDEREALRATEKSLAQATAEKSEKKQRTVNKDLAKSKAKKSTTATGLNEKSAQQEPFSTFSLHVSDVSFKLARLALGNGSWPDPEKVRVEEFVNAFDYGDPMPSQSDKVACRIEQSAHPFLQQRNLMRVSMRTAAAGRTSSTPLRLTLLVDNSGSMERFDRQQTLRRAFITLAQQLQPIDQVTLISFARQPRLLADQVSGKAAQQLVQTIANLPSEGGTNLESALTLAFEKALEQRLDQAQNRVILLTDGAVNLGNANPESLAQIITNMRGAGIAFDAAGISSDGLNDEVLEALTRQGDGRYYLLDSLETVDDGFARQVAGALRPAAKNVKVQVQFNPKRVNHYKLLGFEKHRLKKEDFRNDKVDAAEMAAEEAGVAVYQFEAKPDGEGDIGMVSVRFRDLSTNEMVENTWPILYDADAPRIDQAAATLQLASSAAMLAAKLRGDPLAERIDLRDLSNLVAGLPERIRNTTRVQELLQMIQQARQLTGR